MPAPHNPDRYDGDPAAQRRAASRILRAGAAQADRDWWRSPLIFIAGLIVGALVVICLHGGAGR